jgi:hypothetical protein
MMMKIAAAMPGAPQKPEFTIEISREYNLVALLNL